MGLNLSIYLFVDLFFVMILILKNPAICNTRYFFFFIWNQKHSRLFYTAVINSNQLFDKNHMWRKSNVQYTNKVST